MRNGTTPFGPSTRGPGIETFGEAPVEDFCKANNFLMIVRGHEVCEEGFDLSLGNKVLTIFSSANYCDVKKIGEVLQY